MSIVESEAKPERVLAKIEPTPEYPNPPLVEILEGVMPCTHVFLYELLDGSYDVFKGGCQLCHANPDGWEGNPRDNWPPRPAIRQRYLRLKVHQLHSARGRGNGLPKVDVKQVVVICEKCVERISQLWQTALIEA